MKMEFGKYSLSAYSKITDPGTARVIYIHGGHEDRESIRNSITAENFALVFVEGLDWNSDTTPWPAKGVFKEGDFDGKADDYLKVLTEKLVPMAEKELRLDNPKRGIAGYSLGGLLAIYSLLVTDKFSLAASMSGSLWYDDFLEFLREHRPLQTPERVYLSLGDKEKKTKNSRMAKVETATQETKAYFEALCPHVIFELNNGNHFVDVEKRIAAGLNFILREDEI